MPPSLPPHSPYQLKEGCHEADIAPPVAQPLPLLTGAAAALAWQLLLARPTRLLGGCCDVHMDISHGGCWLLLVAAGCKPVLALAVGLMRVGLVVVCGCIWLACVQHMLLLQLLMPLCCGCRPLCAIDSSGRMLAACWPLAAAVAVAATGGAACCCCCQLLAGEHDRHLVQCLPVEQPGADLKQGACSTQCTNAPTHTETCVASQLRSEGTICAGKLVSTAVTGTMCVYKQHTHLPQGRPLQPQYWRHPPHCC